MFTLSRGNKDKGYLHKIESRHKKAKTGELQTSKEDMKYLQDYYKSINIF